MSAVLPIPSAAPVRRPSGSGVIVEIRDAAGVRALVPEWEALAAEAIEPNPFYEHWMLLPALEAYGEAGFRCLVAWDSGKLVGLVPLRIQRGFRGLPVRAARSWRHRNMLLGTPLVRARGAARTLEALLVAMPAAVLELEWTPAEGPLYGTLLQAAAAAGLPWLVTDAYSRALLATERDPRERFNSNMRNNLRRWEAKLRAAGEVQSVALAREGDLACWVDAFMRLEASGWKGEAGSALACRPDDRRFVAQVLPEAFRRDRLLIAGLDLAGRPLARHIVLRAGEGGYTFKIAYDEAHAAASPGVLSEVANVSRFIETPGLRWVDSNTTEENSPGYERVWKDRRTVQRIAFGVSAAGQLALASLPFLRLAKRPVQKLAARLRPRGGGSRGRKGS
ncbi:MAG: GNAT family N-acetyltransferase [Betaproteobacteria bacterium]|nr:GNAT family N-acetyltransferase [Betaproteobacteria bacterium]